MNEGAHLPNPLSIEWRIGRNAFDWDDLPGGYRARYELAPDKIELIHGKLFMSEEERLIVIGLLLENVGLDKVMRLGDPRAWQEAAAALSESRKSQ